jgi:BON domain/zinc-ribbon domain
MFCRKCGAENRQEAKFCQRCGTALAGAPPQHPPQFRAPAPAPPPPFQPPQPPQQPHRPHPQPPPQLPPQFVPQHFAAPPAPRSPVASGSAQQPAQAAQPAKSSAWIWILIAAVVLAAAAAGAYFLYDYGGNNPTDDAAVLQKVRASLFDDPSLHGWMIGVASNHGVVTLSGSVGSEADKLNAERIANSQPGVKRVVDLLIIQASRAGAGAPMATNQMPDSLGGGGPPGPAGPTAGGPRNIPSSATPTPEAAHSTVEQPPVAVGTHPDEKHNPDATAPTPIPVVTSPKRPATPQIATRPIVAGALIQPGATSLRLPPGNMYLYGLVTGGEFPTSPFISGPYAQTINAAGQLSAALAYGPNNENSYSTQTGHHLIGGASVSGTWSDFKAFYGSNGRANAYIVAAPFTVKSNALVVVIATAGAHGTAIIQGVAGLQIDAASHGNALPMLIGHAYLAPGQYVASETSTADSGQHPKHMADLIGVFVFETGN